MRGSDSKGGISTGMGDGIRKEGSFTKGGIEQTGRIITKTGGNRFPYGFTLIELMVVLAIIAILAAIAIPAYQDYIIRTELTEGISLGQQAKIGVTEYYSEHGTFPATNADAGLDPADQIQGKYVSKIEVADGSINVTFGNGVSEKVTGKVMSFRVIDTDGTLRWSCQPNDIPIKYLPSACRQNDTQQNTGDGNG